MLYHPIAPAQPTFLPPSDHPPSNYEIKRRKHCEAEKRRRDNIKAKQLGMIQKISEQAEEIDRLKQIILDLKQTVEMLQKQNQTLGDENHQLKRLLAEHPIASPVTLADINLEPNKGFSSPYFPALSPSILLSPDSLIQSPFSAC